MTAIINRKEYTANIPPIRRCRVCKTTSVTNPCGWYAEDLCSRCAEKIIEGRLKEITYDIDYLENRNDLLYPDKIRLAELHAEHKELIYKLDQIRGFSYGN